MCFKKVMGSFSKGALHYCFTESCMASRQYEQLDDWNPYPTSSCNGKRNTYPSTNFLLTFLLPLGHISADPTHRSAT